MSLTASMEQEHAELAMGQSLPILRTHEQGALAFMPAPRIQDLLLLDV